MYVRVCVCVCINCVYLFIVFFFECVGVLPFDGEIKMYIIHGIWYVQSDLFNFNPFLLLFMLTAHGILPAAGSVWF